MKNLADCRVLLVDDAKANLDILVEGLKGDHKLSLALHGEMALQIAAKSPPDLVLLDIMLPGLDGYEVCRRSRQMPETAEATIMFLSMFMVRAISLARLLAREIAEPERILARLNDELASDNPSEMFVTFLCAVFEPKSGRLTLANAGHCRPVLLRAGESPLWAVNNLG